MAPMGQNVPNQKCLRKHQRWCHWVCRAQSTPSYACPTATRPSNPYSKPPDNNTHHARFLETLLTSTLVVFITGQIKNNLTYLNRRLVKSTVVHSNTPCHHIRRYLIIITWEKLSQHKILLNKASIFSVFRVTYFKKKVYINMMMWYNIIKQK